MPDPPNILQSVADYMGYGDFGCFSEGRTQTPALDQLTAEGLCLTQQYSASPVCNPARACLLTGRYPHRTGSIDTLEWRGLERLALRETTLADVLRAAGYRTGHVGKWHLGAFDERYHPLRRGFDEAVCFRGGMHDYWRWRLEFGLDVRRGDGRYLTDVWTDEACAFLQRRTAGEPFFLQVMYNAPHTPLQCPEEDVAPFVQAGRYDYAVSIIYGMIRRMDRGIGRILETLRERGLEDDTIVLFTSDNGPQFGGAGPLGETTRFNCHWRGCKGTTYEGGIRVPGLVRWPGRFEPGRTVGEMVHFADWFPTLLAAAGVDVPKDNPPLDGVNVLPVLLGAGGEVCRRRFWQWNRYTPLIECNAAVRDGDWKLVRPRLDEAMHVADGQWLHTCMYEHEYFIEHGLIREPDPPRDVPPPPPAQLFHLADDPGEQHDLADQEPRRAGRMLSDLETWFEQVEADRASIDDQG